MRRLLVLLSLAWATIWALGIGVLAAVAIQLSDRLWRQDLDSQLALYATAAYGLSWFDEAGEFHDELIRVEPELLDGFADLWVVEPGAPPVFHMSPSRPRFRIDSLAEVARRVVELDEELSSAGVDSVGARYRLFAIPTYRDGATTPHAAVVVLGDPTAGALAHSGFVRRVGMLAVALGVVGLLGGIGLAWVSLRPARAALERGERFLVAAAHELRTPVATLRAVSESGIAGDESREEALQRVARVAATTSDVVGDLLLFARLDAGEQALDRQQLRLDLLVELCLPEGAVVELDSSETVVSADPRLVKVAVRNLIENAMLHGSGAVRVAVTDGTVVVEDGGAGLPARVLDLARRPFSMAPSDRGAGIGLGICRMIAELHGGALELGNRPGGGARVTLRLVPRDVSRFSA